MRNEILNKSGKLSAYGFSCGYVDRIETETLHKQLFMEHGIYHVQSVKNNTPHLNTKFEGRTSHQYIIWESFEKLTDARKFFKAIK